MARWPDFFIAGAAGSGTTSLYRYLWSHPDVFMPSFKEPHFFYEIDERVPSLTERVLRGLPPKLVRNETDYMKLFDGARPGQVTGEASVHYLENKAAASRIKDKNPRAKILILLREPAERAHSQYLLAVSQRGENNRSFFDALREDHDYMVKFSGSGSFYVWPGLYYQHVARYLDTFGEDQVSVHLFDDLAAHPTELVRSVCSFLGVEFYDGRFFDPTKKYRTYGEPRNFLFNWVSRSRYIRSLVASLIPDHLLISLREHVLNRTRPKPPLDPGARDFLRSIYRDEILKLQGLIGRDLSGWLDGSPQ